MLAALLLAPAAQAAHPGAPTITVAAGSTLAYQGLVTFTTTNTRHGDLVVLSCYQDVNGDGTIDTTLGGPDTVYSWVDAPTAQFSFSGQGQTSTWTQRGGGAAVCRADLDNYGRTVVVLATTGDFAVSA